MVVSLLILLLSLALFTWSVVGIGPALNPALLLAVLGLVMSVLLLIRSRIRRPEQWIVVDGSNVMYWHDDTPRLNTVRDCIEELVSRGWTPVLWFDANVGYLVASRYMGPRELSRVLRYPASNINVAPKGTPADPLLIEQARNLGARIVTNDRYREWAQAYPQVADPDLFLRGSASSEGVTLRVEDERPRRRA
ncbi:NYN domain-containing protein [Ruegeria marina]|uniref:Zc3h12a-like Ribonuclease NYN domain-containing protein n=1 Tax=Ruegeria marina TaxID=639004 RepID=A0A1G6LU23_9RHOB|nr:hypothetical protein [Ruegeria marina]SDC46691.1 Zc3h12a-like Ribonuclease NYN domain-containing protein [Ruegeria marina]